jgi:hypothetical protein
VRLVVPSAVVALHRYPRPGGEDGEIEAVAAASALAQDELGAEVQLLSLEHPSHDLLEGRNAEEVAHFARAAEPAERGADKGNAGPGEIADETGESPDRTEGEFPIPLPGAGVILLAGEERAAPMPGYGANAGVEGDARFLRSGTDALVEGEIGGHLADRRAAGNAIPALAEEDLAVAGGAENADQDRGFHATNSTN